MIHGSRPGMVISSRCRRPLIWVAALVALLSAPPGSNGADRESVASKAAGRSSEATNPDNAPAVQANQAAGLEPDGELRFPGLDRATSRSLQTVALFALVSLAPVGLLMLTAFVRINIVLTLLRQAVGSPLVPGNQVLTALSLLLTALVMWPWGEKVYHEAIEPYAARKISLSSAWDAGSRPIKAFMVGEIVRTRHEGYLEALNEYANPGSPGRAAPIPTRPADFPLRVVAPAFLLSELMAAMLMGFYIYLPFLVIDLVVSSVLAATGLFMLPPALITTPVKLILFVLADGWILVATMLLSSFGMTGSGR
jgi:flagellar biosynthesis protein FliP